MKTPERRVGLKVVPPEDTSIAQASKMFTERQLATLPKMASAIIPAEGEWPAAGDVVTPAEVESRCVNTFALRDAVCAILDYAYELALMEGATTSKAPEIKASAQVAEGLEVALPAHFRGFVECVYEIYYSDPRIQRIVERRTGFRIRAAVDGVSVAQFEEVLFKVADVGAREKRVRPAEEAK